LKLQLAVGLSIDEVSRQGRPIGKLLATLSCLLVILPHTGCRASVLENSGAESVPFIILPKAFECGSVIFFEHTLPVSFVLVKKTYVFTSVWVG
jgi:hypothetical protein